jgi:DNA-binding transcriptional LysR family regulator
MWNADMAEALQRGTIDVAVSLCPELAPELADQVMRTEPAVVVLAERHRLARERAIGVAELADEELLLFPRELAPRLHDVLVGICRRGGFEPRLRSESFHTGWDLLLLPDVPVVALAPASVASALADGVVAVPLGEPGGVLETRLLWRDDDRSPTVEAFRAVARAAY